jgi:RNA polymerase sigma-70 factor (ECF subfamily)
MGESMSANSTRSGGYAADEAQLISDCQAGNRAQFQPLVSPYLHSIKLIAYSILQNTHDMEDVVQETVLKALTHIHQLHKGENFKPWLVQIAVNEARLRLRKDRRHLFESIEPESDEKPFRPRQFADWRSVPSEELERKEIRTALTAALSCLGEKYRAVFVLRDMQHLSSIETGKILGLSDRTVNTRLHRARLQMREHLTPLFKAPGRTARMMSLKMMVLMGRRMMRKTISCRHATREISNYIDGQLTPELRRQIEDHLRFCDRCSILLDTTRKLLYVVGDECVFSQPFESKVDWQQVTGVERHRQEGAP